MTTPTSNKHDRVEAINKLMALLKLTNFNQAAIIYDGNACAFCQALVNHDMSTNTEEVGEFWSETLSDTVLAHPDCLPMGIDDTLAGKDPEWSMA